MAISRRNFCKKCIGAVGVALGTSVYPLPLEAKKRKKKGIIQAKRVLIIAFDGIRIDGLKQANTPNIDALMKSGAASLATRDVMPSITLPNFTSILTGAGPEVHGVTGNSWQLDKFSLPAVECDEDGYFPSVFKVLKDQVPGIKTAFYWNWKPLINPYNKKYFDETLYADKDEYVPLYEKAFGFMKAHRNDKSFIFLYTVHTDHAGHRHKWMSPEYIKSIEEGDAEVGRLINRMKEEGIYDDTHILFLSDHGGIGNGHGGVSKEEMIVPWIIEGPGIKKGFAIEEANNTVNTASTVLHLFGAEQPLCWTGEVPLSIFE